MNLKLSFFALLVIFSAMANKSLARYSHPNYGCGKYGNCWTVCDEGKGWCYAGKNCTDFSKSESRQCSPGLECKLPRVCRKW
jgi:hypothetical protein